VQIHISIATGVHMIESPIMSQTYDYYKSIYFVLSSIHTTDNFRYCWLAWGKSCHTKYFILILVEKELHVYSYRNESIMLV